MIEVDIIMLVLIFVVLVVATIVICLQQARMWRYYITIKQQFVYIKQLEGYLDSILTGHGKTAQEGTKILQKPMRGCKK